MKNIDEAIRDIDNAICDYIDLIEVSSRGRMSDAILKHLRDLVEHIAVKVYSEKKSVEIKYEVIKKSLDNLKTSDEFYFLRKFHSFLRQSASHYTQDVDGAERLMLKYYEYLLQIKIFVKKRYDMVILHNIDKFPMDLDKTMQTFYKKIVEKLETIHFSTDYKKKFERFYVQKSKPFFIKGCVYYESTLIPANDKTSKFNRLVVFSKFKIHTDYAINVKLCDEIIDISGKLMPIKILMSYRVSIRPCELKNFAKIFGKKVEISSTHSEYIGLMNYITNTGLNLVEILSSSEKKYEEFKEKITERAKVLQICDMLDEARKWIVYDKPGSNVVRYLLYNLNNKIIKLQYSSEENYRMKGLFLDNKAIPFDEMPYNSSLYNHNPSIYDLFECIEVKGREHELLARRLGENADNYGKLYTSRTELEDFKDIDILVEKYNGSLYKKHTNRKIDSFGNYFFVKGYENDTLDVIKYLIMLTEKGIAEYSASFEEWLQHNPMIIDSDEKKTILLNMFDKSSVAMIYGAAGTGKSTLIRYISQFWADSTKVYIATTHPAVENLKRKVRDSSATYLTIKKFINSYPLYRKIDILFIDECSMVSNRDMVDILKKRNFKLLVLVGDIYQIESIRFGNWFDIARYLVPIRAQYELKELYRTDDKQLLELWRRVRNYQEDIAEWLVKCDYTTELNETIFKKLSEDEIVLCLNYDGLYGINNINRFLQNENQGKAVNMGVWTYKIGDPVLFNDSSKYESVLYNNLKGKIINIEEEKDKVYFSIEIDKVLNGMQIIGSDLELMPKQTEGKSIVRFPVKKKNVGDDDNDDDDLETNVPFQIAYAISIHKAQGLEYNSVKIVITKEVDEMITHNIFYTAITRAKEKLKIYWTAESQQKILNSFKNDKVSKEAKIFAMKNDLTINKKIYLS